MNISTTGTKLESAILLPIRSGFITVNVGHGAKLMKANRLMK